MDGSADMKAQASPTESPPAKAPKAGKSKAKLRTKTAPPKQSREQSTIAFPYQDLEQAIVVARAIHENGGGAFTREQLGGAMKLSPTSGNFVLKTLAARLFGLIEDNQGKRQLTQLGYSILDKDSVREKAARAQAFLNVPLYRKIYDEFKGKQLPSRPHGLEQALIKAGVVQNLKAKTRIVFDKAAAQAGFYAMGQDRLIEPIIGTMPSPDRTRPPIDIAADEDDDVSAAVNAKPATKIRHHFIQGLVDALPEPGTNWAIEGRTKWLQAAAHNFDLMYKGSGEIQITAKAVHEPVSRAAAVMDEKGS